MPIHREVGQTAVQLPCGVGYNPSAMRAAAASPAATSGPYDLKMDASPPHQSVTSTMGFLSDSASTTPSRSEGRRSNKPVMEKKRRARINHCLGDLKSLILDAMKKDPSRHSKLEKADILEMTVKHLQNVQRAQLAIAVARDPRVLARFKTGFAECATEATRYVTRIEGCDAGLRSRMASHLSACVSGLQSLTPLAFTAMAAPSLAAANVNIPTAALLQQAAANSAAAQHQPQGTELVGQQQPHQSQGAELVGQQHQPQGAELVGQQQQQRDPSSSSSLLMVPAAAAAPLPPLGAAGIPSGGAFASRQPPGAGTMAAAELPKTVVDLSLIGREQNATVKLEPLEQMTRAAAFEPPVAYATVPNVVGNLQVIAGVRRLMPAVTRDAGLALLDNSSTVQPPSTTPSAKTDGLPSRSGIQDISSDSEDSSDDGEDSDEAASAADKRNYGSFRRKRTITRDEAHQQRHLSAFAPGATPTTTNRHQHVSLPSPLYPAARTSAFTAVAGGRRRELVVVAPSSPADDGAGSTSPSFAVSHQMPQDLSVKRARHDGGPGGHQHLATTAAAGGKRKFASEPSLAGDSRAQDPSSSVATRNKGRERRSDGDAAACRRDTQHRTDSMWRPW